MTPIRARAPDGRRWTPLQIARGKPLGHPTHVMLVHFPVGLAFATAGFDLFARARSDGGLQRAAAYLAAAAALTGILAAAFGLLDWAGMVRGSTKRRMANRHLVAQSLFLALTAGSAALRWPDRGAGDASLLATGLALAAVAVVLVGNYFGGELVYRMAMGVNTGGERG